MDHQTATASRTARRRILYLSLTLSAALHVALLTALMPGTRPDTAASGSTARMEIALQGNVQSPPLPEPLPVRDPLPLEPLPVPQPVPPPATTAETAPSPAPRERSTTAVDTTAVTAPVPQPRLALTPLPTPPPERDMSSSVHEALSRQIEEWLQDPQQFSRAQETGWEHEGQRYRVQQHIMSASPTRPEQKRLTIHTYRDDRAVSTSVTLRRLAFSRFAKFVDRWDDNVWLAGDEVIGRFHSNSRIRVETSRRQRPVFHGPVTVAANMYLSSAMRSPDIFRGGIETGVDVVPMPRVSVDVRAIEAAAIAADQHARFFDTDTEIEFLAGTGYRWRSDDGSSGEQAGRPILYLIARGNASLSVQGTVAGQVLVYAPRSLRVTGSLTYHRPPDNHPGSSDLLGLVSDGSIIIAGPQITGRGDLDIHAAIYAGRRFSVQRFRSRQNDRLTILGSLTAGSVSATEPRFSTRVIHDNRFAVLRPPLFPQTTAWTHEPVPPHWTDHAPPAAHTGQSTLNRPPGTLPAVPGSAAPDPAQ